MSNNLILSNTKLLLNFCKEDIYNDLKVFLNGINSWDYSYMSRKTKSFGIPYEGDHVNYSYEIFPDLLVKVCNLIEKEFNFRPNNCLINYYYNGLSKMGYHSDNIENLSVNSGILILSFNSDRILRLKSKESEETVDFNLLDNSLFFMSLELQRHFKHSILSNKEVNDFRVSFTFRKIKTNYAI